MSAVRTTLRPAERGLREAMRGVDAAIRDVRSHANERVKALEQDRKVLEKLDGDLKQSINGGGPRKRQQRKAKDRTHEDFVKLAGRKNVEKVREYLEKRGKALQSAITKDLKMSSGNVSHALRALASHPDGSMIALTGRVERASKEYEYIGAAKGSDDEIAETKAEEKEGVVASAA